MPVKIQNEHIKSILSNLPGKPGVYQYFDKNEKIIYVGKAKNLKKRVSSYFHKDHHDYAKTKVLVSKIVDIKFILVDTEMDALFLENNLIKKYQPRYNIMLKDDKTYPWICIKKERFPRVFSTRRVIKDGSEYFGPYASSRNMKTILELIGQLYQLRTCNYQLSEENIQNKKFKVCLDYHIKKCLGPCEGHQSEAHYQESINNIRAILKGNSQEVKKHFRQLMMEHAENLEFEEAQSIKEKLDILEKYQAKSTVVSPTINNIDVFSIISDDDAAYVNFFKVMNGAIIQSHTLEIKKKLNESDVAILQLAVFDIRQTFGSLSKEIITNVDIDIEVQNINFHVPKRGDKKQLIDLSLRNVKYFRQEKIKQMSLTDPERHSNRILEQLKKDLRLHELPKHIECFDNSNIQGTNPVAACVVFKNAKPSKKDYRNFNIKTVVGPDDFASMEEVVYRRYRRLLDEKQSLPQLIVIDGGKGQLGSALKALEQLELRGKIAIIGIAKRLEEIYYPGDSYPLYLDKRSESLKIIQQLRNEAHRFGITHHRDKRSKAAIGSELDQINGIGPATVEVLLKHFKSVKRVQQADIKELEDLIGLSKAQKITTYFNTKTLS
jgi:excinuclease ABC subunit C